MATDGSQRVARHYIDGTWVADGELFDSLNPHDGAVVCRVHEAGPDVVDRAVAAARCAFRESDWRTRPASARARVLLELADRVDANAGAIARLIAYESGKPTQLSLSSDVYAASDKLRFFAGAARTIEGSVTGGTPPHIHDSRVMTPIGVAAMIVPWNDPVDLVVRKLGAALAAGCAAVVKSSEETPASTEALIRLCEGLPGLPDGIVNLVHGRGTPTGEALVAHPDVDKVSFTGSSATGKRVMELAAGTLKRISLECGGKAPSLVFSDCNRAKALEALSSGAFLFTGQSCTAVTRVIVEDAYYEEFVAELVERAKALVVGDALDPATKVGPLVARRQADRVKGYLDTIARAGGTILTGGEVDGCYVQPTVVADLDPGAQIAVEEVFGPVVLVFRAHSEEEMLAIANCTRFGLAASIWTQDIARVHRLAEGLEFGDVWVNTYYQRFAETPFGGWKESGIGCELGLAGLREYLAPKRVAIDNAERWHLAEFFPPVPDGPLESVLPDVL